ncbi:hypothetical protein DFH29DRAFT_972601 [Suillus ampliporus]|nr:hypothetical protein DFH29DRAFT_972601 [Suillus ampliporus]
MRSQWFNFTLTLPLLLRVTSDVPCFRCLSPSSDIVHRSSSMLSLLARSQPPNTIISTLIILVRHTSSTSVLILIPSSAETEGNPGKGRVIMSCGLASAEVDHDEPGY